MLEVTDEFKIISSNMKKSAMLKGNLEDKTKKKGELRFFEEGRVNVAKDGTVLRSRNELEIYSQIIGRGIACAYERTLNLGGKIVSVDFTLIHPISNKTVYWEHFGMLDMPESRKRVKEKISLYAQYDIFPGKNLILTYNEDNFGLDSRKIAKQIEWFLIL